MGIDINSVRPEKVKPEVARNEKGFLEDSGIYKMLISLNRLDFILH